tara:strand:- start:363 stop:545 length:183 start_codon:yes stop_codon:yes gene_type:complete
MKNAKRQFIHELKNLLHRWSEESDLKDKQLLECVGEAVDEYFEDDVFDFESDIDLEEDEE